MNAARFSVSTPVGAYHPLLRCCLESLRQQDGASLTVSLLDASNDPRVQELADEYRDVIAYRRHGADAGQGAAIREGWERSGGDILGWLNADDLLFPGALSAVAARFTACPALDVVYGHSAICDERMRMTGYHWAVSPPGDTLELGCNISQPSCFFRRRTYEAVGGLDATLHYTMDWDLWLRFRAAGARFSFIEEPLSAVFWGEGTKTSRFNAARRRELSRLINRYTPKKLRSKVFRGFAVHAALDHLRPPALQKFMRQTLMRNRQRVFGVGPDGRLDETAVIKWFHLDSSTKSTLAIAMAGHGAVDIQSSQRISAVTHLDGAIVVRFAEPVAAASAISVELRTPSNATRRFRGCEWHP